jgi:hypothetical protein
MTNSWSLLYDTMTKHSKYYYDYDRNDPNRANPFTSDQSYWEDDGFSLTGNPMAAQDTIIFGSTGTDTINFGAAQPVPMDYLSLGGEDSVTFNLDMSKNNKYKYSEDVILKELTDYIAGTYNQHYSAGDDKIQTLDLIEACGDGESFCRSNILKYASRYDKKGTARRDILKILHYAVLLMHFNDKNAKRETYPQ